jgi:hypothetical protein
MTKFQEAIQTYVTFMNEKLNIANVSEPTLVALAQMLGDNIFDKDASLVACSDKDELARVKHYFLINELGLQEKPELDKAIQAVCKKMGASNRKKFRVVFYYLLLEEFGIQYNGQKAPVAKTATTAKLAKKAVATQTKETAASNTVLNFEEIVDWYKSFIANDMQFPYIDHDLVVSFAKLYESNSPLSKLPVVDLTSDEDFENVKNAFVMGRLGIDNDMEAVEAIDTVKKRFNGLTRYRVPFYYLLTKHLGKEWVILQPSEAILY